MSGVRLVHRYENHSLCISVAIPAAARTVPERLRKPPALTSTL